MSEVAVLPGSIEPAARKGPDLTGAINPLTGIIFGGSDRRRPAVRRLQHLYRHRRHRHENHELRTVPAPFRRAADRARLRIRQRLSRHRKRSRDRHLHPIAAGQFRGRLVGNVQPARRADVVGRRRLRHHLAAAGRIDPAGRQQRRLCDGLRAADRRHPLESGNLGVRPAGVELAHLDRLDHRRRRDERHAARSRWHLRASTGRKAKEVGEALLLSPLFGFALAAALLLLLKAIVRIPALYAEPKGDQPPPWWIRASSSSPARW